MNHNEHPQSDEDTRADEVEEMNRRASISETERIERQRVAHSEKERLSAVAEERATQHVRDGGTDRGPLFNLAASLMRAQAREYGVCGCKEGKCPLCKR